MRRSSGFSLLELTVAAAFMGLLLAGMIRVYGACLDGWYRVNDALTLRRALRGAMERLAEDLRMVGHLFPPPECRALDLAAGADPRQQSAFMLVPGEVADELSFVVDVPVPVQAELGSAIPDLAPDAPLAVQVRPARAMSLEAGDLLLVGGEWSECVRVEGPAEFGAGRAGPVRVVRADRAAGAVFRHPHGAGAPVQAVRPLRVVRYAVVGLDLEPGRRRRGPGALPCLVRFETAYRRDRAAPHGREGSHEVVAEHVTGFRVDYAPDGVFPGIRGADYATTVGNLDARLQALHGRAEVAAQDPFWFRTAGGLVSVRLDLGQAAGGGSPSRRFPAGGRTLVVAPRNFGL